MYYNASTRTASVVPPVLCRQCCAASVVPRNPVGAPVGHNTAHRRTQFRKTLETMQDFVRRSPQIQ